MLDSDGLRSGVAPAVPAVSPIPAARGPVRRSSVPRPGWSGAVSDPPRAGGAAAACDVPGGSHAPVDGGPAGPGACRPPRRASGRAPPAGYALPIWPGHRRAARRRGPGRGVRWRPGRRGTARCRAGGWASSGTPRGWRRRGHRGPRRGRGRRPAECAGRPGRHGRPPRSWWLGVQRDAARVASARASRAAAWSRAAARRVRWAARASRTAASNVSRASRSRVVLAGADVRCWRGAPRSALRTAVSASRSASRVRSRFALICVSSRWRSGPEIRAVVAFVVGSVLPGVVRGARFHSLQFRERREDLLPPAPPPMRAGQTAPARAAPAPAASATGPGP